MKQSPSLPLRALSFDAGFTLIEVMVALMIVGIALPALMFQLGTQLDNTGVINDRTQAAWVAQDQLALLQLRQAAGEELPAGEWRGDVENAGRRWYWLRVAEATPAPGLLRHSIRVADSAQGVSSTQSAQFSLDAYLMRARFSGVDAAGAAP
ncbi:MAG: type II secretion system minor pseudopilin GspI [Pseudohongiella sp.]|nr:type II secretion system minor pseudopilin GspI [Pseudohongiella sp.]